MDDNEPKPGTIAYLRLLASVVEEGTTLGPTDAEIIREALRDRAAAMKDDDFDHGSRDHAAALADLFEDSVSKGEETIMGPTDTEMCLKALRSHVALIDAGLA